MRELKIHLDIEGAFHLSSMEKIFRLPREYAIASAFTALIEWMAELETGKELVVRTERAEWMLLPQPSCTAPTAPYLFGTIMGVDKRLPGQLEQMRRLRNFWKCTDASHLLKLGLQILVFINMTTRSGMPAAFRDKNGGIDIID